MRMPAIASSALALASATSSWKAVLMRRRRRPKTAVATITAGSTASITSVSRGLITNSTITPPTSVDALVDELRHRLRHGRLHRRDVAGEARGDLAGLAGLEEAHRERHEVREQRPCAGRRPPPRPT
jgi:hypothetical protein